MTTRVRRHAAVEQDILSLAGWIARDSRETAFRFLDAVEQTIVALRAMPGKGSPKRLRGVGLVDVRSWAVRRFPNHLIFYDLRAGEIFILAVIHGSRRYQKLLRERC